MSITRALAVVGMTLGIAACSSAPTSRQLGEDALAAMGGADRVEGVNTLTMRGGVGTRYRHGQPGAPFREGTCKGRSRTARPAHARKARARRGALPQPRMNYPTVAKTAGRRRVEPARRRPPG